MKEINCLQKDLVLGSTLKDNVYSKGNVLLLKAGTIITEQVKNTLKIIMVLSKL